MAVVTVKSTQITNRDATPVVLNNARVSRGEVKHARANVAIANGDSIASKYLLFSIPSNAIPVSCRVTSPDIGTTTAGDLGLYQTTANGGAVVDADFFASALSLSGGALSKSEALFESTVIGVDEGEEPVWELLGLTADTKRDYDVVLTLTAAADAAGTILVELDYVI